MKRLTAMLTVLAIPGCGMFGVRLTPQKIAITSEEYDRDTGKLKRARHVEATGAGVTAPRGTDLGKIRTDPPVAHVDERTKGDEREESMGSKGGALRARITTKRTSWILYGLGGLLVAAGAFVAIKLGDVTAGIALAVGGLAVLALTFYPQLLLWLVALAILATLVAGGIVLYRAHQAGTLRLTLRRVIGGIEDAKRADPAGTKAVTAAIGQRDPDDEARRVVTKERAAMKAAGA